MKTLFLLRHAKSGFDEPPVRDVDRQLNAKGRRAARTIGRHLRDTEARFDHVLASPARRVAETLAEVEAGYGRSLSPTVEKRLYLACPETLLDLVHALPADAGAALLVGHNPGLEELVLLLVPDAADQPLRDDVELKFPTASVAELAFEGDNWAAVAANAATLKRFTRPRDLDPTLGPEEG